MWLYYATCTGMSIIFPPNNWGFLWDPTRRPWYGRAISVGERVRAAISTPYVDGGGAGLMNTLSSVVYGKYGPKKVERKINGVMGYDFLYPVMNNMLPALTDCSAKSVRDISQTIEWTLLFTAQAITEDQGVTVTQGTNTGLLKTTLSNEWTLGITPQAISENVGVTVSQNEWTLAITAQGINESAGVTVTQGSLSGTLKTALSNEWTLAVLNAPVIAETAGVTVSQDGVAKGTLISTISGGATSITIETVSDVTILDSADVTIGSTVLVHANINNATKNKYKAEIEYEYPTLEIEQLTNAGYVYAKYIHAGSNGAIYQAKYTIPSRSITILGTEFPFGRQEIDVAVKVEKRNDGNVGDIEHEGKVLAGMWNEPESQKYTVQYYGACGFNKDGSKLVDHTLKLWGFNKEGKIHETEGQGLIMEFCPNGNLEVMHEKQTLTPENKLSIVKHFANGMLYLHKLGFIHQDLKPGNIMTVFNEGRVVPKIMDYGGGSTTNQPFRGSLATSAYQPPELKKFGDNKDKGIVDIITEKFKKIDVFQFGVIANEIYMSSNGANFDNWLKNAQLEDTRGMWELKEIYDSPFKKEWLDKLFHKFKTKLNIKHVYDYFGSSDEEVGLSSMLPNMLSTPMTKWVAIHHYLHRPGQAEMTAKIPLKDGETMKELICACWSLDPDDRPAFDDIVDRLQ